jgi:predicted alpha-1,2-mannosidase
MTLTSSLSKKSFAALLIAGLALAVFASTGIGTARGADSTVTAAEAYASVNPWIGTGYDVNQNKGNAAYGNTWPGAAMPFGMTQFTPTTHVPRNGYAVESEPGGYEYESKLIRGFGMTRLSGTGCEGNNSAFDLPLLPYTGALTGEGAPSASPGTDLEPFYLEFEHSAEQSSPGYYKVGLKDGVEAQLGATLRTTIGQFKYPAGNSTMLFDASGSNNDSGETKVTVDPATRTISGYTTSHTVCGLGTYRIYFSSEYDAPFADYGTWGGPSGGATVTPNATEVVSTAGKNKAGVYLGFASGSTVTVRTGISYVSVAGAEENREVEDPASKSFEEVHTEAREAWEEDLGTIKIASSSAAEKTIFYTALYHALLQPNVYEDVDGKYRAYGAGTTESSEVKELAPGQEHEYATYSGWDQYRSQSQLIALLFPKVGSDIAQSITDLAVQTGKWYNWPHLGSGQDKMQGDALQSMVAEYAAFGDTEFEERKALESMVSTQSLPGVGSNRSNLLSDVAVGWIEARNSLATSTSLEYDTADFAIGQLAKELGDTKAYEGFMSRAQHWQDLISPSTHAIVPRERSGYWSQFELSSRASTSGKVNSADAEEQYDQSTGYQYQWSVPFNVTRLIEKLGGKAAAKTKLETLLTTLDAGVYNTTGDYMSNEPAFITPWIYSWLGAPDKTMATIDRVRHELFNTTPEGLAGNDDLGALSAYYVWSSIGLYPAIYGRSELVEAAPAFENVEIHSLGSSRAITTERDITGTTVNGTPSTKNWLPAEFARDGGTIEFALGTSETSWGTGEADVPPSYDEGTNGYNGIAITKNGVAGTGSLDFSGNSLSAERLAEKGLVKGQPVPIPSTYPALEGVEFTWPNVEPGEMDSWIPHGQVIQMGDVRASKISFLGLATNGPSLGTAKVVYSDGTSTEVPVDYTDWTPASDGAVAYGNAIIAKTVGRNNSAGAADTTTAYIYATAPGELDTAKLVEKVILPENVTSGIQHIFAVGTDSLAIPTVSIEPTAVTAGEEVEVSGSEYTPDETVEMSLSYGSGSPVTEFATADASGNLEAMFKVPGRVPTGSYELTVTGEESGYPAQAELTVTGFAPAVTATSTVLTGGSVAIEGSGFAPDETVTVLLHGAETTVKASATGTWSTTLTAPEESGAFAVLATGAVSETLASQVVIVKAPEGPAINTGTGTTTTTGTGATTTTTTTKSSPSAGKASKTKTSTVIKVAKRGTKVAVTVTVAPGSATGKVTLLDGSKALKTLTLKKGKASVTLKLAPGSHKLSARFLGSADDAASKSKTVTVKVTKK